ncbi:hypothetical protein Krac_3279 [Ktedonobacter racemifer DSM 44963]|uniref:Uncharacterized protein n=1 Tax=Ktedonobacter racemifer DSM 44963 TaxID=485913 RepID=D6U0X7_KTERA|nr:hypothetical protein Krac_3279 [Ktedonobacter racemifer DSM 44963]
MAKEQKTSTKEFKVEAVHLVHCIKYVTNFIFEYIYLQQDI